jgi:hypothetical protein
MVFLACAAALCLYQDAQTESDRQRDLYAKTYAQVATRENIRLIADINLGVEAPKLPSGTGRAALIELSKLTHRFVVESGGTYLLVRKPSDPARRSIDSSLDLMAWLKRLNPNQMSLLRSGEFLLSSLNPSDREIVGSSLAAGSEGFNLFFGGKQEVALGVQGVISIDGPGVSYESNAPMVRRPGEITAKPTFEPLPPLRKAPDVSGPFDFGGGRVLTVLELAEVYVQTTKEAVSIDGRLLSSNLFVSGRYEKKELWSALEKILEVEPIKVVIPSDQRLQEVVRAFVLDSQNAKLFKDPTLAELAKQIGGRQEMSVG